MQTILNGITVEQEERTEGILEVMSNKYSRDLLKVTQITTKVSSVGLLSTIEEYFDNMKWY